ncbi:MAG: argininosuccinate lyase, partial [Oscillospiraceae bacterium]
KTMTVLKENMRNAAAKGFINATDCADYLTKKGLPFRDAYKATGELVAICIDKKVVLETLPLEDYQKVCDMFQNDIFDAISLETCVNGRKIIGAPAKSAVIKQIENVLKKLG